MEVQGPKRIFAGDPHLHSTFSDGKLDPGDLLLLGAARGLDFLAVADHNTVQGSLAAMELWRDGAPGPRPFPAQEVSTEGRLHLLVYGLEESLGALRFAEVPSALARACGAGAAVVLAHPWSIIQRPAARSLIAELMAAGLLHGVELCSAALFYEEYGLWRDTLAWYREECARFSPAILGGTDWHDHSQGFTVGLGRTVFLGRTGDAGEFTQAIREGRTAGWLYQPALIEHGLAARASKEARGIWPDPDDGLLGNPGIAAELRHTIAGLGGAGAALTGLERQMACTLYGGGYFHMLATFLESTSRN